MFQEGVLCTSAMQLPLIAKLLQYAMQQGSNRNAFCHVYYGHLSADKALLLQPSCWLSLPSCLSLAEVLAITHIEYFSVKLCSIPERKWQHEPLFVGNHSADRPHDKYKQDQH